jgi:hypothetical protein
MPVARRYARNTLFRLRSSVCPPVTQFVAKASILAATTVAACHRDRGLRSSSACFYEATTLGAAVKRREIARSEV